MNNCFGCRICTTEYSPASQSGIAGLSRFACWQFQDSMFSTAMHPGSKGGLLAQKLRMRMPRERKPDLLNKRNGIGKSYIRYIGNYFSFRMTAYDAQQKILDKCFFFCGLRA